MFEEIAPEVMQVIIEKNTGLSIQDICGHTGFEKNDILKTVDTLIKIGILKDDGGGSTEVKFCLVKELKGIQIARAAQLGVNVGAFGKYFKIDKKEKQIALDLSSSIDKIKVIDIKHRKPLIQKRLYLRHEKNDDISDNLMLLLEASNANLYKYLETLSEKDNYLKLLLEIHRETERSWSAYIA